MPLQLLKASKQDIPELVNIYFTTFKSPLVLRLKPNLPSVRKWYQKVLEEDFVKSHVRIYKVVEEDTKTIIAFAKWNAPITESSPSDVEESRGGSGELDLPVDGDVGLFKEVLALVSEKREKILKDEKHWYLSVLATLPQHQRRGAASILMSEFCRQADGTALRGYLEASPTGKALYERFGFDTKDTFSVVIDGGKYVDCCMVRETGREA